MTDIDVPKGGMMAPALNMHGVRLECVLIAYWNLLDQSDQLESWNASTPLPLDTGQAMVNYIEQ